MRPVLIVVLLVTVGFVAPVGTGIALTTPANAAVLPAESAVETSEQSTETDHPHIVDLYPNPATFGDVGEVVTVWCPAGSNLSTFELADDHVAVPLVENTSSPLAETTDTLTIHHPTEVTFSTNTTLTASLTDRTVRPLSDRLRLADRGDRIRLLQNGTVVDEVSYDWAPEAEVYDAGTGSFEPLGATDRPVVTDGSGTVEAFVLPDEGERAVEFLDSAEDRILLGGYTLSSAAVVDALEGALERGVTVEVLAEGTPVGGKTGSEAAALDTLDRAGVTVRVIGGDRARYRYHHAKYAIVDDRALVTTENWKPAGTGGQASRGWAVITDQERIVEGLVDVYEADTGWEDAIPWNESDPTLVDGETASRHYPTEFDAQTLPVERAELLVAPDNAEERILDRIAGAETSLDVKQVHVGDRGFPFLQAVLDAADRGVEVRILLSREWYVEDENRELKAWLEEQAAAEDWSLAVRLAEPGDSFEKIHAKGLIIDGETVLVGSINWTNNSIENNREVALLLEGREIAGYYEAVFDADWEGDTGDEWVLPLGLAGMVGVGALVVVLAARQIEFESSSPRKKPLAKQNGRQNPLEEQNGRQNSFEEQNGRQSPYRKETRERRPTHRRSQ